MSQALRDEREGTVGVKGGMGDRNARLARVERELGDKRRRTIGDIELRRRPLQIFAVINQLLDFCVLMSDLGQHPPTEQT